MYSHLDTRSAYYIIVFQLFYGWMNEWKSDQNFFSQAPAPEPPKPVEKGPIPTEHQVLQDIFDKLVKSCAHVAPSAVSKVLMNHEKILSFMEKENVQKKKSKFCPMFSSISHFMMNASWIILSLALFLVLMHS